jgi:hypothetical protein
MSTYQMVVRSSASLLERLDSGAFGKAFWNWWIGVYAEPPRKLPPMI